MFVYAMYNHHWFYHSSSLGSKIVEHFIENDDDAMHSQYNEHLFDDDDDMMIHQQNNSHCTSIALHWKSKGIIE